MSKFFSKVGNAVRDMLLMSVFLLPAFMAPLEAKAGSLADPAGFAQATGISCQQQKASIAAIKAEQKAGRIAKISMTKDCKYPVYDLQGDLDDINYTSHDGSVMWQAGDLLTRIGYLDPVDVGRGYTCEFVCKDTAGNIVGINPSFKKLGKRR